MYPCTPLLNIRDLKRSVSILQLNNKKFIVPVVPFPHPIERALIFRDNKIFPIKKKKIELRSQQCQKTFHDSGQFYWAKVGTWVTNKSMLLNSVGYKMSQSDCIDINVADDWKRAEQLFKILKINKKKF